MKLLEYQGKRVLAHCGLATPDGGVLGDADEVAAMASALDGPVVVKAQIPTGKRGKSGAVRFADTPGQAREAAEHLLRAQVAGHTVTDLLVERALPIATELYAAVLNDPDSKGPLLLFSTEGGMDIEELHATHPEQVLREPLDIRGGWSTADAEALLRKTALAATDRAVVAESLVRLYEAYRQHDADLVEINPLVLTEHGAVVAADAKVSLDSAAIARQPAELWRDLSDPGVESAATSLEAEARESGLQLIELDGEVGVLANGAGLTMTTLDTVNHYGGRPANFLEIGGEAYTKATAALRLVLRNPNVRSLLVNFCGAFARTDVMTEGVVAAIETVQPEIPVFFTIHGTGEDAAVDIVRRRLGTEPYEHMDDAVDAAVAAATTAHV